MEKPNQFGYWYENTGKVYIYVQLLLFTCIFNNFSMTITLYIYSVPYFVIIHYTLFPTNVALDSYFHIFREHTFTHTIFLWYTDL